MIDLKLEFEHELKNILKYWVENTVDEEFGGFVGRRDSDNLLIPNMPKGSVLNSRILWTFSAAYLYDDQPVYKQLAERAYQYIKSHFYDEEFGGVYWSVNYKGDPEDTKKQTYALSFAIYGLTEFYKISNEPEVLNLAIKLFHDIEKHCFDKNRGGYFEAFSREWEEIEDLRLSEKDANEKKTMNTHLHVLEAYTNLYRVWKDEQLEIQITILLYNFKQNIIDKETNHLILFMDENWEYKQHIYSYGHDIEAAWLLLEAAEVLDEEKLITYFKTISLHLADAAMEGLDEDGSLLYENNLDENHFIKEKHWWVQAEGMVGFFNAFEISRDDKYKKSFENIWNFTKTYIIDKINDEWHWGRKKDLSLMKDDDKVGIWKCPYHNSRACLELLRRL